MAVGKMMGTVPIGDALIGELTNGIELTTGDALNVEWTVDTGVNVTGLNDS
jgi:hypothetical protein